MTRAHAALAAAVFLAAGGGFAAGWTARGTPVPPLPPAEDRSVEPVREAALTPAAEPPPAVSPAAQPVLPAVPPSASEPAPVPAPPDAPVPAPAPAPSQEALLASRGFNTGAALDLRQRSERLQRAREYLGRQSQREESAASLELARTERKEIGDDAYSDMLWSAGIPNRIVVEEVLPNSNASRLGMQKGDIVLRYDGERLFEMDELRFLVREPAASTQAELELVRDGKVVRLNAPRGILGVSVRPSFDPPREDLQQQRRRR